MNAADPMPWGDLVLAAWPLWAAFGVVLVVANLDRVCALVARLATRRRAPEPSPGRLNVEIRRGGRVVYRAHNVTPFEAAALAHEFLDDESQR